MSAITSAVSAYRYAGRYAVDNQNSQYTSNSVQKPASTAPQREAELKRELDERLSTQIARIRRQSTPDSSSTDEQTQGLGRNVDIRA